MGNVAKNIKIDILGDAKGFSKALTVVEVDSKRAADALNSNLAAGASKIDSETKKAEQDAKKMGGAFESVVHKIGSVFSSVGGHMSSLGVPMAGSVENLGGELENVEASGTSAFGALASGAAMAGAAIVAGAGYGLLKAGEAASNFQAQMMQIHTQAGAGMGEVAKQSNNLINLAPQVGESVSTLASGMYHIESVGFRGSKALNILKVAAQGAQVGNANLVDVTNALDAAVVSGIPGVQNYQQAMGTLNAAVGAGDMSMQDMADAMGTGILATSKQFGLSLNDVGAALAVFGDNNIRGADAATKLRMALQYSAVVSKNGAKALATIGMSATEMSQDFHSGGLVKGLQDLQNHLQQAGISSQNAGTLLAQAFGKRAGVGLQVLLDQLPRLKSKYEAITAQSKKFGSDWKATTHTTKFQLNALSSGFGALEVKIGEAVLPIANKILVWFNSKWPTILSAVNSLQKVFGQVFSFIGDLFASTSKKGDKHLGKMSSAMTSMQGIIKTIGTVFSNTFNTWIQIFHVVTPLVEKIWNTFSGPAFLAAQGAIGIAASVLQMLQNTVQAVYTVIADVFTGNWQGAWDAVKKYVMQFANDIVSFLQPVKDIINGVGGALSGIGSFLGGIFGGGSSSSSNTSSGGSSPDVNRVNVPHLATGGLITKPTLALVGEAGPEMVVPLRGTGANGSSGISPLPNAAPSGVSVNHAVTINVSGMPEQIVSQIKTAVDQSHKDLLSRISAYAS